MLIIFESPDKTGKTTLSKLLSKSLEIPYVKLKNIDLNEDNEIKENISISTKSQLETVVQLYERGLIKDAIFDRLHISEYVYNNVYNRNFDIQYLYEIENRLSKFNDVFLIRCKTNRPLLRYRWKESEHLNNINLFDDVFDFYEKWYKSTKLEVINVDTNLPPEISLSFLEYELYKRGIYKNHPRPKRQSHEVTMMKIALEASKRGTCLNRQVGAVLTEDGYIVGVGYNGPPSGLDHCKVCVRRERNFKSGEAMELSRAIHAEENAIIQSGIRTKSNKRLEIFCTNSPCIGCMKKLIQIGINQIYYIEKYNDELAWKMAEEAGVEMIQLEV